MPQPEGHYSPVVEHQGVLYVSGLLPRYPDGSLPDGAKAQTHYVLQKLSELLAFSGSALAHVIQTRVYINDVADWAAVNAAYIEVFGEHRPARCIVPCGPLHHGCLVEIEAVAAVVRT